jgi:hypothetical protein
MCEVSISEYNKQFGTNIPEDEEEYSNYVKDLINNLVDKVIDVDDKII